MLKKLLAHSLAKDTLILFGVQISGYVLPLITLPFLARVLGPTSFGLTALGTAVVLYFVVVTEWGFAVVGTRQIAIAQNDEQVSRTYSTIMACKLLLLTICFFVMIVLIASIPKLHAYWPLYLVSFLQVVGSCFSPNWLMQGMQKMRYIAYSDYGAKIISVLLIFALVRHSSDYVLVAALQSGGFLVSAIIGLTVVFGKLRVRIVKPAFSDMREAMIVGWPVFLSMASMTAMTSTNTVIVGTMASPAEVGYLNGAQRLIIATRALTNPIAGAAYPHISKLAVNSRQDALSFVRKLILWTSAPFLLITIGILSFAPFFVSKWYGPNYAETGVLLRIMAFTPFLHAIGMCFGTYFMLAFGFQKEWSKIITRMVILNFVLVCLLVPFIRPARAIALTTSLTDLFSAGSSALFYRKTAPRLDQEAALAAAGNLS